MFPYYDYWVGLNQFHKLGEFEHCAGQEPRFLQWYPGFPTSDYCVAITGTRTSPARTLFTSPCDSYSLNRNVFCEYPLDLNTDEWDNVEYSEPNKIFCDLVNDQCPKKYSFCYEYLYNEIHVCAMHGICLNYNNCSCSENYYTNDCGNWSCNGKERHNIDACSNGEVCISHDNCGCLNDKGVDCAIFMCHDILATDPTACSGDRGNCTWTDYCECNYRYFGGKCEHSYCYGVKSNNNSVCNSNGQCLDYNKCQCLEGYFDNDCKKWQCFSIDKDDVNVCGGKGTCIGYNNCKCKVGLTGNTCKMNYIVFLSLFGVSTGIICVILIVFIVFFVLYTKKKKNPRYRSFTENELAVIEEAAVEYKEESDKKEEDIVPDRKIDYDSISDIKGIDVDIFTGKLENKLIFIREVDVKEELIDKFVKEFKKFNSLSIPLGKNSNIVVYHGYYINNSTTIGIISPKLLLLKDYFEITKKKSGMVPLKDKIRILIDLAKSLRYLHEKKFIHGGVRFDNFYATEKGVVKLGFGVEKVKYEVFDKYVPPEIVRKLLENVKKSEGEENDEKEDDRTKLRKIHKERLQKFKKESKSSVETPRHDVYSFGICMFELITENYKPYNGKIDVGIEVSQNPNLRPSLGREAKFYPNWFVHLMKNCYHDDPSLRPSFSKIVSIIENVASLDKRE